MDDNTISGRTVTCGQHPHACRVSDKFADPHPMGKPWFVECECGEVLGWFSTEAKAWGASLAHGRGEAVEQEY